MMRQIRKQSLTILALTGLVFLSGGSGVPALAQEDIESAEMPRREIVETYISDPLSGVAIYGFDPVSYFTGFEPEYGLPEYELVWNGLPWYFANAANRDIFKENPEIYAPQFGGYGLMSLARGYLSEGNPRLFEIIGDRLFFFYSNSNRDAFMLLQRTSYEKAVENWEMLSKNLVGAQP